MRGKLSLLLLAAAVLSVAGVAAAQPCEPTCAVDRLADAGGDAGLPAVVPFAVVGVAIACARVGRD